MKPHMLMILHRDNALETKVHNDGTNQMVEQASINAAANVDALVTQCSRDQSI